MTKILLVRHGNSLSNVAKTFTGHINSRLSEMGEKQAERACEFILKNYKVDIIYSSDLSRAVNTVKPLANALNIPIHTDENLREIYGGKWEGVQFSKLEELFYDDYSVWKKTPGLARPTDGESYEEAQTRFYNSVKKIAEDNPNKTVVIASHGGVIRGLQCKLMGLPLSRLNEIEYVVNASVTEIDFNDEKLVWARTNPTEYLDGLITSMPKGI